MIRSIQKCDEGSDKHNDLTFTQELIEELGRLKLANVLAEAVHIGTQAPGCGRQSGGSRGGGHHVMSMTFACLGIAKLECQISLGISFLSLICLCMIYLKEKYAKKN